MRYTEYYELKQAFSFGDVHTYTFEDDQEALKVFNMKYRNMDSGETLELVRVVRFELGSAVRA